MADESIKANVCQYWREDEPGVCSHWSGSFCSYTSDTGDVAEYFPFCNFLGTRSDCKAYDGDGTEPRCVLPDPYRHVVNRADGKKWVETPEVDKTGLPTESLDFGRINGYEDGKCDGAGTTVTCSGYSPYILQFGTRQPDDKDGSLGVDAVGLSTLSGVRLPLSFEIYNRRARLSKCHWWEGEPLDFEVDESTKKVKNVEFKCKQTDEVVQKYSKFEYDKNLGSYRPPCNGCKPECPHYTGAYWEYCIDSKMRQGDRVLAEQILEIRWNVYKESWDSEEYYETFEDPEFYAWLGSVKQVSDTQGNYQAQIPAMRTYIDNFETFSVGHAATMTTEGLHADDYTKRYPTLVKRLGELPTLPIVRNKFDETTEVEGGKLVSKKLFEVTNGTYDHSKVLILGDTFHPGAELYILNLSDPELAFLPKELWTYCGMDKIEKALGKNFAAFYSDFDRTIETMKRMMPEKMATSELSTQDYQFYMSIDTFWGKNNLIVLSKIDGRWEYVCYELNKPYQGGIIGQTSFKVEGDGGAVTYLPSYANDFGAYNNKNGEITFKFFPMVGQGGQVSVAYAYIDGVRIRKPANPAYPPEFDTYEFAYKLYKTEIAKNLQIKHPYLRFIGNAGYAFVKLPDEYGVKVTTVTRDWEIDNGLFVFYPDGTWVEMEIYEKCTPNLAVDAFVIRPKDLDKFKSVPREAYLSIGNLYVYERRTFDPPAETGSTVINESFIGENDVVQYRTNLNLAQQDENSFSLTNFGYESLMASVLYRGLSGRIIGQIKTKLLVWIRQPYCRDVEINYSWTGYYHGYKLVPEYNCYDGGYGGGDKEISEEPLTSTESDDIYSKNRRTHYNTLGNIGVTEARIEYTQTSAGAEETYEPRLVSTKAAISTKGYTPPCGDHELSYFTGIGPMWYPYNDCDSEARYLFRAIGHISDAGVMEVFSSGEHGDWDMRMLGPPENDTAVGESHSSIWACICDYTYYNFYLLGKAFSGYANTRGGLDALAKAKCIRADGLLPKFGNVYRDFLRSYRSIENVDYYYWNGSQYTRRRKWVPMYEFYSGYWFDSLNEYPYKLFSYSDYTTDNSAFIHQFGCLVATDTIEGVSVQENIRPERHRFENIFRFHSSIAGIAYPVPRNPESRVVGGVPVEVIPWYTYKDPPGADPGNSIQWVWREDWKSLERTGVEVNDYSVDLLGYHPTISRMPVAIVSPPYSSAGAATTDAEGRHIFINLSYPNYRYDGSLKEHRLVRDEGQALLKITPPEADVDHPGYYQDDAFWTIQLNEGPKRCFDIDGNWVEQEDWVLYHVCTEDPWVTDINIFDTGYNSTVPDPDRTIISYDEAGDPHETYYQRGLSLTLKPGSFGFLPRVMRMLEEEEYEIKVSGFPSVKCNTSDSEWAEESVVGAFYPATRSFDVEYCADETDYITITFKFNEYPLSIGALGINFTFGSVIDKDSVGEDGSYKEKGTVFSGTLYHLPGIVISASNDDSSYTNLYELNYMKLATKTDTRIYTDCFYEMPKSVDCIKPYKYFKLQLRIAPSADEVKAVGGDYSMYMPFAKNKVGVNYLYVYYNEFLPATETIATYERLYNISIGGHGTFPPHGYDSTGSLLYVLPEDKSTVYQMDSIGGVVGMPFSSGKCTSINKARGRIMFECHPDKESIPGRSIGVFEARQKEIHDAIAFSGETTITLTSAAPPNMSAFLEKTGINFPSWNCVLTNTLVAPLAEVPSAGSPYSPGGHTTTRIFASDMQMCGSHGSIYARVWARAFDYQIIRAADPSWAWTQPWAPVIYFHGAFSLAALALTGELPPFIKAAYDRRDQVQARINKAQKTSPSRYTYPGPVDPVH